MPIDADGYDPYDDPVLASVRELANQARELARQARSERLLRANQRARTGQSGFYQHYYQQEYPDPIARALLGDEVPPLSPLSAPITTYQGYQPYYTRTTSHTHREREATMPTTTTYTEPLENGEPDGLDFECPMCLEATNMNRTAWPYQQTNMEHVCENCEDSVTLCDGCGGIFDMDVLSDLGSGSYCEYCYSDRTECSSCGEVHYNHDIRRGRCYDCRNSGEFANYSDHRAFQFYNADGTTSKRARPDHWYLGVELEMELEDEGDLDMGRAAEIISHGTGGFFVAKEDGSLEYGVEAVSFPAQLEVWHNHDWSWLKQLRDGGARAWNVSTPGLHVHVSTDAWANRAHFARWWMLMFGNRYHWTTIAGRHSQTYASWDNDEDEGAGARRAYAIKPPPETIPGLYEQERAIYHRADCGEFSYNDADIMVRELRAKWSDPRKNQLAKNARRNNGRYTAINCQNDKTVELRFWRPSMRPLTVLAAIEGSAATVEYTRNLPFTARMKEERLAIEPFLEWCAGDERFQMFAQRAEARMAGVTSPHPDL